MEKTNEASETPAGDEGRRRRRLIEQCLAQVGKTWAASLCEEMAAAGRGIEGGWPGRLAEARALVLRELTRELGEHGMAPPSAVELAGAPSTLNEHARRQWLQAGKTQRLTRTARGL